MGRGPRTEQSLTTTSSRSRTGQGSPQLVEGTPFTQTQLSNYCNSILDSMNIGAGDIVGLDLTQDSQRPFAKALAREADVRGAKTIFIQDPDPRTASQNMHEVIDRGGAVISVDSMYTDRSSSIANNVDGDGWAHYEQAKRDNDLRWNITMWPTADWAQEIYPELPPNQAYQRLGGDILSFAHADDQSLAAHMERLQARADALNAADIDQIHLTGPGTDLSMKLLPGSRFLPCDWETRSGQRFAANIPTDEVFTTPDPDSVEGTFRASRPLVLAGRVFEEVSGRFEGGRLVEIHGQNAEEDALLGQEFLNPETNKGRDMIGELGLVDPRGRIGQSGRTYYQNIIDENAGSHIGLGASYAIALDENAPRQGHQATGHSDIIIGSPEISISATTKSGAKLDIVKDGAWVDGEDKL